MRCQTFSMKVVFFSNFMNHHQLYFCENMYELTNQQFTFVATKEIDQERLDMGYEDMNIKYPFILRSYMDDISYEKAKKLAIESDIMIFGSAPEEFSKIRMEYNRILFRVCERYLKDGIKRLLDPRFLYMMYQKYTKYRNKNEYILCASAYTQQDLSLFGIKKDKCFKWGYFPKVIKYDLDDLMKKKNNDILHILWVGRFIDWKHPKKAVMVADRLKKDGYKFKLNMIGNGDLLNKIKELVKTKNLDDCIEVLGAMSPGNVREYMEKSNIFLFTSDRNEGWGAVLNEAMNSACAIVTSNEIGAVPYLIENGVTGLIYKNNNNNDLYNKVINLIDNQELCEKMGLNAYEKIENIWNAKTAANNLFGLFQAMITNNHSISIESGPCSNT